MDIFEEIFQNINTWLVVLATGAIVWIFRQAVPEKVNDSKGWRLLVRAAPILVGAALAAIPGLRPLPVVSQSVMVGIIGGSFSTVIYEIAREAIPTRFRNMLGSRSRRLKELGKKDG